MRKRRMNRNKKLKVYGTIVVGIVLVLFASIFFATHKPVETNINAYVPEGYHSEFTRYRPEWGETLTDSCNNMIARYQMDDFITTYEYINVVMKMNNITDDNLYQADTTYIFPYIITNDVVG